LQTGGQAIRIDIDIDIDIRILIRIRIGRSNAGSHLGQDLSYIPWHPERMVSARLLTLLSLLQTPRDWPGSELAARLEVSPRTIRRDIERLRELGYPVQTTMGAVGGYRLAAGTAMPPLLLDDEEAVAIAVGLRTAASHPLHGIEEASLRALAKLEQVLPSRLRHRVTALASATVPLLSGTEPQPTYEVVATVHLPADQVMRRLGAAAGEVEPIDSETCRLRGLADTLRMGRLAPAHARLRFPGPRAPTTEDLPPRPRHPGRLSLTLPCTAREAR
jgi:biotin operon repressor